LLSAGRYKHENRGLPGPRHRNPIRKLRASSCDRTWQRACLRSKLG